MRLITREVRWFFDGDLAADGATISAWFAGAWFAGATAERELEAVVQSQGKRAEDSWPEDWRADRYLLLPNTDDVGVKLRQGRLEIKGCHSLIGIQKFGDSLEGEVACWTKWTLDAPEWMASSAAWSAMEAKATLRVAKLRTLHFMQFSEDGVIPGPAEQEAEPMLPEHLRGRPQGKPRWSLQMELTRIRVAGAKADTHWSLAFEAYPDDPSCRAPFAKAVATLLAGYPAGPLDAKRSMSYPRWIQRLASETIRPE